MCNCRRRRNFWLNNSCDKDKDKYETMCNNVPSNDESFNSNCGCGFDEEDDGFPINPMYAQSYVPVQVMNETYTPCHGLSKGTIFPELVSPYCPGQSMAVLEYIRETNAIKEGCNR